MNHLYREIAPITETAWAVIDDEARGRLATFLGARKVVDFAGPLGWTHSAVDLGRVAPLADTPAPGTSAAARRLQPLIELRAEFALTRTVLDDVDRGAPDPDLDPLVEASRRIAFAEDNLVFNGYRPGAIEGVTEATPHRPIPMPDDFDRFPTAVAQAIGVLREAGIGGPYAIALGPDPYTGVTETAYGGYPVLNHVRLLLDGPIVWAPAVACAVVLSLRGGDFELTTGEDLSIGYLDHDAERVRLFLEETVTFRALTPEAAVAIVAEARRPARDDTEALRGGRVGRPCAPSATGRSPTRCGGGWRAASSRPAGCYRARPSCRWPTTPAASRSGGRWSSCATTACSTLARGSAGSWPVIRCARASGGWRRSRPSSKRSVCTPSATCWSSPSSPPTLGCAGSSAATGCCGSSASTSPTESRSRSSPCGARRPWPSVSRAPRSSVRRSTSCWPCRSVGPRRPSGPRPPNPPTRRRLGIPPGSPVLHCERVTRDTDGKPVLLSAHVFPGHRTEFAVDLPQAEPSIAPTGLRLVE